MFLVSWLPAYGWGKAPLSLLPVQKPARVASIQCFEHSSRQLEPVVSPPHSARHEFVRGLEQSPPSTIHRGRATHVRSKKHAVLVFGQELSRRPRGAADFVITRGDV